MDKRFQMSCFLAILWIVTPAFTYASHENSVVATINVGVNSDGLGITSDGRYGLCQ